MSFYTFDVDNNQIFRLDGDVGIGTANPSEALDVSGNIRCFNSSTSGGVTFKGDAEYTNLVGQRHVYIKANGTKQDGTQENDGHIIFVPGNGVGEKVRINKDGNVGIGTTNPQYTLDVSGNVFMGYHKGIGNTTGFDRRYTIAAGSEHSRAELYFGTVHFNTTPLKTAIIAQGIGSFSRSKLMFCLNNDNNNDPSSTTSTSDARMTILPSGDVGIGTDNPQYTLDVSGIIRATNNIYVGVGTNTVVTTGDTETVSNTMLANSTISGVGLGSNLETLSAGNGILMTNYNGSTAQTIALANTFTVTGDIKAGTITAHNNTEGIQLGEHEIKLTNSGVAHYSLVNTSTYNLEIRNTSSNNALGAFSSLDKTLMAFNSGGNVGIGTTDPQAKLHIDHSGNEIGDFTGIRISNHAVNLHATTRPAYEFIVSDIKASTGLGNGKFAIGYRGTTSASRTNRLVIDTLGNIGIGTNNPGYPLDIKGSTNLGGAKSVYLSSGHDSSKSGTSQITIQSEKDVKATAYIATSDERIKKDILDINDDAALQKLRIIEPKTYKYKDVASRGTKTVFGFIAQQIDTVLPEAVSKLNDVIPNTYELCDATSSSNNDYYDTITFTNFNTANLDTSSNNLVLVDANNKNHSVNITAVLDSSSVQVDTDLLEWMGAVDASNETMIANEVQKYKKVILDANNIVVLENYDIAPIASMDASENVVGNKADLSGDNTIDSSNNYVDASGNFIAGPINTDGHYIDASGNYFDADGNFKDASGTLIGTYKAEWKNVIVHGTTIFVYGQEVDDFHALNKDYIFTVATAALQEVDRQLQAEKAKTATLETQMADLLARVTALESA